MEHIDSFRSLESEEFFYFICSIRILDIFKVIYKIVRTHNEGAWRVCCDGYVTADSGTGVVHQAPYFGADDFRVCIDNKIITKDGVTACPVDSAGKFTQKVKDYTGQHVKDADKEIIARLKADGRLVKQARVEHFD